MGRNDGPWVDPDDLRKVNGILRYNRGDARNGFSVTGLSYSANWHATDQVPVRAIESGQIDRFAGIDTTGGGRTYRHGIVADILRSNGETSTRITAFGMRYGLNLLQNFTYFLANPVDGDQFEQVDRRTSTGGKLVHRRLREFLGRPMEWKAGTQLRHDDASVIGLYDTVRQRRTNTVRENALRQTSLGVFGEGVLDWTSFFRTSLGIRADVYRFAVDANNPLNAGAGVDSIVSPKLTAILGPWQQTEFYANWGEGFHSNDVRCATIRVDPRTGEPAERFRPLVKARGGEIGRLEQAVISSRDPFPPTLDYIPHSGGLFRDLMIHDFDMAHVLFDEEPVEVTAMSGVLVDPRIGEAGDVDSAMALLRMASGALCHINCSRRCAFGYDQRIELFGELGMLISANPTRTNVERYTADGTAARDRLHPFFIERYQESYVREIDAFVDAVENGVPPTPGFDDGRRALLLADAAEESARTGRVVRVSD